MKSNQMKGRSQDRSLSRVHTATRSQTNLRIFVSNLPTDIMRYEIMNLFGKIGIIDDCFIRIPAAGSKNTYAFVTFSTVQQAEAAIRIFNQKNAFGKIINVSFAKERREELGKPAHCCCNCHKKEKQNTQPQRQMRLEMKSNKSKPSLSMLNKKNEMMKKKNMNMNSTVSMASMNNNSFSINSSFEEKNYHLNKRLKFEEKGRQKEVKGETEKPKSMPKNYLKPREKEAVLLAISTDISRSQESEDFYSYEAKPFSDFCLKREEE